VKLLTPNRKVPSGGRFALRETASAQSRATNKRKQIMKAKAVFYHAGCPVCVAAEQNIATALDPKRYDVEIVHLGQSKSRVTEAEKAGVKSVPALVLDGQSYHINFGAGIEALK
jgi:glutaredoxin